MSCYSRNATLDTWTSGEFSSAGRNDARFQCFHMFPSESNDFIPSLGNWEQLFACLDFQEEHLDDKSGPLANLNVLPPTVGGSNPWK
jgi:hypothetical protein